MPKSPADLALEAADAFDLLAAAREDGTAFALLLVPTERANAAAALLRWSIADLGKNAGGGWPFPRSIEGTHARLVGGVESEEEDRKIAGALRAWAEVFAAQALPAPKASPALADFLDRAAEHARLSLRADPELPAESLLRASFVAAGYAQLSGANEQALDRLMEGRLLTQPQDQVPAMLASAAASLRAA